MDNTIQEQLMGIIQHAYENAPTMKTIMDAAGLSPHDIQTISDLDKIPVTSKDRLAELQIADPPFGGFLAVPQGELQHIFLSPGPLYEPHAGETSGIDSIREVLSIAGFTSGDMVLNAFGYHFAPSGILGDQTLREIGATVIPVGVGNPELQIKIMKDLKVTGFVGVPSWLMTLLQKIDDSGLNYFDDFTLKKALVSAEPLPPSLRQTFVEQYKLEITNAYGTAELGFLAYNNDGGLAMQLLETSIIQVVNPDTGKSVNPGDTGEVVVTTFDQVYPLIRLGTGDLAINIDPAPGESHQKERSIILVGRVGDAVKVRGMFVHPNQISFAVAQVLGVERVQAVITRPEYRDVLNLRVIPSKEGADRDALTNALMNAVQISCRVKVDQVEFISPSELEKDALLIVDQRRWE
jgi:phenylacetate-CoA ligase